MAFTEPLLTHRLTPFPEERRLITVLFADLQGFTPLAETLDPEEVSDLLNRLWQKQDALVERFGGRVDKHFGDAVMAVWGAPRATEEDAEHAVTCALAMQKELDALAADFPSDQPPPRLRVGINSGAAVASMISGTGEYSVIGDVVNVAARLQSVAPPGGVVIGPGTYRLVRDTFRLESLPPQMLKGRSEPVETYRVVGAESYPARVRYRSADSLDMRLVGRDGELMQLQDVTSRGFVLRQPQMVFISGEAGVGKSRLVTDFSRRLESGPRRPLVLSARALPQSAAIPYFLWGALWTNRLKLMRGELEDSRRSKFSNGLLELWGDDAGDSAQEAVQVLGYLAGLDWPDSPVLDPLRVNHPALFTRAAALAAELFRRVARTTPLVILLDDLHNADPASLDLFDTLLGVPDLPLLLIAGSRSAPEQTRPTWKARPNLLHMRLGLLPSDAETLSAIFPRAASLPEAFRKRLAAQAEGSPYFLEEMVKALFQNGVIVSRDDGWHFAGATPPESIPLPDSLRAQLQARLDALSPEARGVALAGSVAGRVFWGGMVGSLLRHTEGTGRLASAGDTTLDGLLSRAVRELERQELAFERVGTTFANEREFIFKHALLRETAYDLLPRKHRRFYHRLAAEWLAAQAAPEYALAVAEHYALAGQPERAAEYYHTAATYLRERGFLREARAAVASAEALAVRR